MKFKSKNRDLQTPEWTDREIQETEAFCETVHKTNMRGLILAGGLAWFGILIFWGPDQYVMPELVDESLMIRSVTALFSFCIFYGALKNKSWIRNHSVAWATALLSGVGSSMVVLCWIAGGLESQYYAAFNLIFIACVLMFNLPRSVAYGILWGIYLLYLSPLLWGNFHPGMSFAVSNWVKVFNNQFFLVSTLMFCTIGYHFRYRLITDNVRHVLRQEEINEKLEHRANFDELTGIPNRRSWMDSMANNGDSREISDDNGHSAIVMVDIDHFKRVNDEHGHQAGDKVLEQVAQLIVETVRDQDHVARFGGEEFIINVTETDDAEPLAERLRATIENHTFEADGEDIHLTVSLGVSPWKFDRPLRDVISCADEALYLAKNSGRNQVRTREPDEFEAEADIKESAALQ